MALDYEQTSIEMDNTIRNLRQVLADLDENGDFDDARENDMMFPTDEYSAAVHKLRDARDAVMAFAQALESRVEE